MSFSRLYLSIEESATLAITKKVRALNEKDAQRVIGLTLGEPDFDTPTHVKDAAKAALDNNITHYPPVAGIMELRKAVAEKLQSQNNLPYNAQNIIVSSGAKQSVFNVCNALINPEDEAIVPAPYWVSYKEILKIAGAEVVEVECGIDNAFKITPAQLEAAITPKTKLLLFSTPSNPTGSMYSQEELAALVEVLEKYPYIYIITDEIYEYIWFKQKHISIASFPSIFERCVVINGFSKGFAMTGWRLGYMAAANKELVYLCEKVQGQVTSGANSIAQMAGIAALKHDMFCVEEMRDKFRQRRDKMFEKLSAIEGLKVILPDGAFYFYPDISHFLGKKTTNGDVINNVDELCLYLIDCGVALIPGSAFGTQNHVRISYAYSQETLDEGVKRLAAGLGQLQ